MPSHHKMWFSFKSRGLLCLQKMLPIFLLFFSWRTSLANETPNKCALYEPSTPGIHCFQGNAALEAVTNSRQAWVLEMYSGWCGHCQNFAPRLKELAKEIEVWSGVIKVGVLECTGSEDNQEMCTQMEVRAYPTIRVSHMFITLGCVLIGLLWLSMQFFQPHDPTPLEFKHMAIGRSERVVFCWCPPSSVCDCRCKEHQRFALFDSGSCSLHQPLSLLLARL